MTLKIIFMGTPEFAIPTLNEIIDKGHHVAGVFTQPPRPAGRGTKLRQTPIHQHAEKAGFKIFTPKSFKSKQQVERFLSIDADLAVVAAYGLILPKKIIHGCRHGCLNVHGSLLPRWRGAAPIQRAIMAGDTETGVTIMQMDEGLDTGGILMAEPIAISANMSAGALHDEMKVKGAKLLGHCLDALEKDGLMPTPQPTTGITYAKKISKAETEIDWERPVTTVNNHIRSLSPFPGAWFTAQIGNNPERIKVLKAEIAQPISDQIDIGQNDIRVACQDGSIRLLEVQKEGKKPHKIDKFLNGIKNKIRMVS